MALSRGLGKLVPQTSALFVCDVRECWEEWQQVAVDNQALFIALAIARLHPAVTAQALCAVCELTDSHCIRHLHQPTGPMSLSTCAEERFRPMIHRMDAVIDTSRRMVRWEAVKVA